MHYFTTRLLPLFSVFIALLMAGSQSYALGDKPYISEKNRRGAVALVSKSATAQVYVDTADHKGVIRAVGDLQADFHRVSAQTPAIVHNQQALGKDALIVGTMGKSALIDQLILDKKIDPAAISGKWDAYHLQVVHKPLPGVERALVIAGASKRGTIYGVYDVSEQIGVSPWYYWADVPSQQKKEIYALKGTLKQEIPKVKYRGIFLNDEAPSLSSWVAENHGNYTHEFYVKVFELMLRLRANYLWPAMWNNAFSDDDVNNMILADEYGIIMGTSHHEPLMRADKEWNRYGEGPWDYARNPKNLYDFWQQGVERHKNYESLYTIAMRGQEDQPMSETENIELLEQIVADQREIFGKVFDDRPVSEVPQVWALYKEVQSYYENGMRVPEDVILLWADDNWGNIRRLPTPEERKRAGGAGVYYHLDYVGMPYSYRWLNVTPIAKIWEQMNLAYHYEANQVWIVNVGDLKPMEYPLEFFLRMAWDPERWPKTRLEQYGKLWATREFGKQYADEIEWLMTSYTRHNGRRKPEGMEPDTYSLINYNEAERIEKELKEMVARAEALYEKMPAEKKSAYFQLVLHPVKASATISFLNIALGKNRLYANQARANANDYANLAQHYFQQDAELTQQYHSINGGKWKHFMNQPHIGYTYWDAPQGNQMPVSYNYNPGNYGELSIAVENHVETWPAMDGQDLSFDLVGTQTKKLELYNRGTKPFGYTLNASDDWIKLSSTSGTITSAETVDVSIDWKKLPEGVSEGLIVGKGTAWNRAHFKVVAFKAPASLLKKAKGFLEADGYISIEAASASRGSKAEGIGWEEIPLHGRTHSSMSTFPITDKSFEDPGTAPYLEYDVSFFREGEAELHLLLAPSWPISPNRGLRYAVAIGDEKPQIIDALDGFNGTDDNWKKVVNDGVRVSTSKHVIKQAGNTKIRIYSVDPALTFQKIIVDTGGLKESYLGPQESVRK
ncbi:Glycosyl hydrolase family 115 [Alteromonadaceae bacterium Bs31]|nr:Glycosyl hydrolase family 115 [Alteromonadaceae bacterium Bs31]